MATASWLEASASAGLRGWHHEPPNPRNEDSPTDKITATTTADTATTTADTVAVANHSLGFTPASSVVLMLLQNHTGAATLRIDARPDTPQVSDPPKSRLTLTAKRTSPGSYCSASQKTEQ